MRHQNPNERDSMGENTAEEDMFNDLPDEILGRIVSFLPNESSLETILLSTRWRNLWNTCLIKHGTSQDMTSVISCFLTRFEEFDPLKHPRKLQFHFSEDNTLIATIANNNKLLLDFSLLKKKELLQMKYYELQFNLRNKQINFQSFPSSTFCVKSLYLKSVSCLTSEVASSIVSILEHLEKLVIVSCTGLKSLRVESKSQLNKLTILDCFELKSLHLKTCKLRSFRYCGPLPRILPEYHFNLSEAMLDFRLGSSCSDFKCKDFDATLLTIKNSQVLTLCKWTFQELIWPSISPLYGSFKFYKLRELWWIDNYKDEYSINALFCFLKLCPALEQLIVTIDPKCYSAENSNSCLIMEANKCTELELEHLKVIKFMGFTSSQKDEISLAKCLVHQMKGKPPKINASDGTCLDADMFML